MGKERNRKHHRAPAPTGLDITPQEETTYVGTRCDTLEDLLDRLQSSSADERASAACVISNMVADRTTHHVLLNESLIKATAPLLLDDSLQVRHCISSCLRDISSWGLEACELLIKSDIMTPIVALFKKYQHSDWKPLEDVKTTKKDDSQGAILSHVLHILCNVCENSEVAVEIFNREAFVEVVYPLLSISLTKSHKICLAAAQCLLAVTENNPELSEIISSNTAPLELIIQQEEGSNADVLLRTICAGILCNLKLNSCSHTAALIGNIKATLDRGIDMKFTPLVVKINEVVEVRKKRDLEVENIEDMEREVETMLQDVYHILQAKKTALEILANICCDGDGDDEDWEDEGSDDGSVATRSEGSMDTGGGPRMTAHLQEAICGAQLLNHALNHIGPLEDDVLRIFDIYKPSQQIPTEIHDIRCRALLCIDNLAQSLEVEDIGGSEGVLGMWNKLAQLAFTTNDAKDPELLEATTSACRAVLDSLSRAKKRLPDTVLPTVNSDEMGVLCSVALESNVPSVRINVTRIVATLACLLNQDITLVKGTGQFLLQVAAKDADLRVCSEALDAIMDVFSEDDTDLSALEMRLVEELRTVVPRFKEMIKDSPKNENRMIASTAKTNLMRFIKYKTKRCQLLAAR